MQSSPSLEDSPQLLDAHGPVFILGSPRSGTTFLADCLGRHPEIEMFIGILAPPRLMHMIGSESEQGRDVRSLTLLARDVFWQAFWRRHTMRTERVQQFFRYRKGLGYLLGRGDTEACRFSYKEPFACFAMADLAEAFPKSRFVHIIRDGRDCADSMQRTYPASLSDETLRDERLSELMNSEIGPFRNRDGFMVPWWIPEDDERAFESASQFGRAVWMWREMVGRARHVGGSLGPDRYLEVRYETLSVRTGENAAKLATFAGLRPSKRVARAYRTAHARSVGTSLRRQDPARLAEADAIAGDLLVSLSYS